MTFVGKILVIVIMAFSLIFLGISTVVFTTAKNWRSATEEQKKKVSDLTKKLNDAQADVDASKKDLDAAKANYDALSKNLNNQIQAQEAQIASAQKQITQVSGRGGRRADQRQDGARGSRGPAQGDRYRFAIRRRPSRSRPTSSSSSRPNSPIGSANSSVFSKPPPSTTRTCASAWPSSPPCYGRTACPTTSARSRGWKARLRSLARSSGLIPRTDASSSRSARTMGWSSVMSCSSSGRRPGPNTSAKSRSSPSIPTRPSAGSTGRRTRARRYKEGDLVSSTIKPRI